MQFGGIDLRWGDAERYALAVAAISRGEGEVGYWLGLGEVAAARVVTKNQQLMIISANGIVTCTPVTEEDPRKGITIQGRSTQGVRLMRLEEGDSVVAIAAFE